MKKFYEISQWQERKGRIVLLGACSFALLSSFVNPTFAAGINAPESTDSEMVSVAPQRKDISGTVKDESGEPLIGAVIMVKGTVTATTTDVEGNYSIRVAAEETNPVLTASYTGHETIEIAIENLKVVNFVLPSALEIEEVVVVGQGVQRKTSVIGSVASVKADNINLPVGKLSTALSGQLAGVTTVQTSGAPGSGAEFYIRGIATFGENKEPLVLVDGIERDIDLVDTDDIESFSILKDASATAIYGVRGANGVMIINTKQGVEGRPVVNIKYEQGILTPMEKISLVNSYQFADLYNEAIGFDYYNATAMAQYQMSDDDPDRDMNLYPNIDWVDALFDDIASNKSLSASISGGGNIARYYVSAGWYNEGSIFKESDMADYSSSITYNKVNFRANVDVTVTPLTTVGIKIANIFESSQQPGYTSSYVWSYAYITSPNAYPLYYTDNDGEWLAWAGPASGSGYSPYNLLVNSGYMETYNNSTQASISLNQTFGEKLEGLSFKMNYAWDAWNSSSITRSKEVTQYYAYSRDENGDLILGTPTVDGSTTLGYSTSVDGGGQTNYLDASLNYNTKINDVHTISGLFLYNQSITQYNGASTYYYSLPYKNQGIAGRVTYDYDNKYFAEFNVGYNGSENFAPGNRFGFFPAFALGWVATNEDFMKNLDALSMLKIRASHGVVGNDEIGGGRRYVYNATITTNGGYSLGSTGNYNLGGLQIGDVANENVGWEQSVKTNLGIDLGFFNNALNITTDIFYEHRTGIFLARASLPDISGITTSPYVNIGEVENTGFETSIEYLQKFGEVSVSFRGNFSYARNTLLNNDEPDWNYLYNNSIGYSMGQYKGYVSLGLFESQEDIDASPTQTFGSYRVGDIKYKDMNGDGVIDSSDKVAIGYNAYLPEISYGFGGTVYYRGWSLGVYFSGVTNDNLFLSGTAMHPFESGNITRANFNADVYENIWRLDDQDPNATYPRVSTSSNSNNSQTSDFWMRDASYLRLKSAELSYDLPASVLDKIKLQKARVYLQGLNLLTFAPFDLWDPENGGGSGSTYPLNTTVNIGVAITY